MKTGKVFFTFFFIICTALLLEIFIAAGASAQDNNAKAYVKNKSVKTGETITLYLDFNRPAGIRPSNDFVVEGIEDFDVLNSKVTPNGIELKLLADRTDKLDIPVLKVIFKDKKGGKHKFESNPIAIKVASIIEAKPSNALLKPVKGIVSTKFFNKRLVFIIIAALSGALIILGFIFFIRRKKNKAKSFIPDIPFHIKALDEIDELAATVLSDKKSIKKFYFRLSEILRTYLENTRNFNALEMTTDEISKVVTETGDIKLVKIFKKIDLVKFADYTASRSVIDEDVRYSKEYINSTKSATGADTSAKPEIIDTDYAVHRR